MSFLLTDVDLEAMAHLPAELGVFAPDSLQVKYRFSTSELAEARARWSEGASWPPHLKTVAHETTHLLQSITTPWGLYIHLLQRLQGFLIVSMLRKLTQFGRAIEYPVVEFIQLLPDEERRSLEPDLVKWYEIELFFCRTDQRVERWARHILASPYAEKWRTAGVNDFIKDTQRWLSLQYTANARSNSQSHPLDNFGGTSGGTFHDMSPEEFIYTLGEDSLLQARGDCIDRVLESAATASEFWRTEMAIEDLTATLNDQCRSRFGWLYSEPLARAITRIPSTTAHSFVLTYLALSELCLYCPILPTHLPLREGRNDFHLLDPVRRKHQIMDLVSGIKPMNEIDNYESFTREVCKKLDWPTPQQIVSVDCAMYSAFPVLDFRERSYLHAQKLRRSNPGIFLDYDLMIDTGRSDPDKVRYYFSFPVITHTDETLYHKDRENVHRIIHDNLTSKVLRRSLISDDLTINTSLNLDRSEVEMHSVLLRKRFQRLIGQALPFEINDVNVA